MVLQVQIMIVYNSAATTGQRLFRVYRLNHDDIQKFSEIYHYLNYLNCYWLITVIVIDITIVIEIVINITFIMDITIGIKFVIDITIYQDITIFIETVIDITINHIDITIITLLRLYFMITSVV